MKGTKNKKLYLILIGGGIVVGLIILLAMLGV